MVISPPAGASGSGMIDIMHGAGGGWGGSPDRPARHRPGQAQQTGSSASSSAVPAGQPTREEGH